MGDLEEYILGIIISNNGVHNLNTSHKKVKDEKYNCRVALWQVPGGGKYLKFDKDENRWLDAINSEYENEIEAAEQELKTNLRKYKVYTHTLEYDNNSFTEISKYPNGNVVKVNQTSEYAMAEIRDKNKNLVAEKCYNFYDNDGRKTIYKNYTQGDNTFTIVRVFSYDTTKNKSTDFINYGYTSQESSLTRGCTLENEYYLLNGKEVKAEFNDKNEYLVKDQQGKKLTFRVELD